MAQEKPAYYVAYIVLINPPSTSGKVLMDGKDIWSLPARHCAQRIATVLQDTSAEFGLSVFEMVEIDLTPKSTSWKRPLKIVKPLKVY